MLWVLRGVFMCSDYGRWNFCTYNFCWVPASNTLYNTLWVQEDERGARIVNPEGLKLWSKRGLSLWLQGERPAPKPLNHKDLLKFRASFFDLAELATSEYLLNLQHSRRPKQTFVRYASLIYEPGATKLAFFFKSGPIRKVFSLSLDVKWDQQTHKKMMSPIMVSIWRKLSNWL